MNTQPVKALATVDKRKITWDDIERHLSFNQKMAIGAISAIVVGGGIGIALIASIVYFPVPTLGVVIAAPLLYIVHGIKQAYQKAKGE